MGNNLYIGGKFLSAGGVSNTLYITRWDGSTYNPLGSGLTNGSTLYGGVATIASIGNNLFIGGDFSSAGGVSNTSYIARWDGSNWYALGAGVYQGRVTALATIGTDLYVGKFSQNQIDWRKRLV